MPRILVVISTSYNHLKINIYVPHTFYKCLNIIFFFYLEHVFMKISSQEMNTN